MEQAYGFTPKRIQYQTLEKTIYTTYVILHTSQCYVIARSMYVHD